MPWQIPRIHSNPCGNILLIQTVVNLLNNKFDDLYRCTALLYSCQCVSHLRSSYSFQEVVPKASLVSLSTCDHTVAQLKPAFREGPSVEIQ